MGNTPALRTPLPSQHLSCILNSQLPRDLLRHRAAGKRRAFHGHRCTPPRLETIRGQAGRGGQGQGDLGTSPRGWWAGSRGSLLAKRSGRSSECPTWSDRVAQQSHSSVWTHENRTNIHTNARTQMLTAAWMFTAEAETAAEPAGPSSGGGSSPEVSMWHTQSLHPAGSPRPPEEHPSPNSSNEGPVHQSPSQPSPGPLPGAVIWEGKLHVEGDSMLLLITSFEMAYAPTDPPPSAKSHDRPVSKIKFNF